MMTSSHIWSQFQANCIVDLTRKAAGIYYMPAPLRNESDDSIPLPGA